MRLTSHSISETNKNGNFMATRDIWVSSDFHLGHANILKFIDHRGEKVRNFDSVKEMNEFILDRHNSCVKPGDIHYNLGDVMMGDREEFKKLWPKFQGRKRLIVGNHDDIKFLSSGAFFQKVSMWRQFPEYELLLSHVPIHESGLYRGTDLSVPNLNVVGHIHTNPAPTRMHYCVCVEQIDYTPVHIEDLAVIARDRKNEWELENK